MNPGTAPVAVNATNTAAGLHSRFSNNSISLFFLLRVYYRLIFQS